MSANKQQKQKTIQDIKKEIEKSNIVMFVNFHGLNVKFAGELRKLLRKIGAKYVVAKKTLIKKALETIGLKGEMPKLEGEVAMAYSDSDPFSPAKELHQFAKKNKVLKILGGIFEKRYIGMERVVEIASIPSSETLLGQIVHIINSPRKGLVVALSEIAKKKQQ